MNSPKLLRNQWPCGLSLGLAMVKAGFFQRSKQSLLRFIRSENARQLAMFRPVSLDEEPYDDLARGLAFLPSLSENSISAWIELINRNGQFPANGRWDRPLLDNLMLRTLVPGGAILVLNEKQDVIGCLTVCRTGASAAQLKYLLVDAEHRGRGVGKAMIGRSIKIARKESMRMLRLLTDADRVAAIRLYIRSGFLPDLSYTRESASRWSALFQTILGISSAAQQKSVPDFVKSA
jgi:ribosomal protein S18 acetylase RimI-like enzyme